MRVVVKVGTSTIAHSTGLLNVRHIENLCKVLSDIKNSGIELILVSSGAIGMGYGKLSMKERPSDLPTKQAAAAVGQCELMYTYDKVFSEYNHTVAQILLTASDVDIESRRDNFINTMMRLLQLDVLPIINENDTVATEEIVIGDNDALGAIVATAVGAELLIMLSDIEGLYTENPQINPEASMLSLVEEITDDLYLAASGSRSNLGTGGMTTKIKAAEIATAAGCNVIIANGKNPKILYDILEGKSVGTRFVAKKRKTEELEALENFN